MNGFEASQIVTETLINRGATCKVDANQPGKVNIIVTWLITTWRILVIPVKVKTDKITINDDEDVKKLEAISAENKQKAVIACVFPDNDIVYYDLEKGNTIRPRCLVRRRTTNAIEKTRK
jgi:hypothetical protein